LVAAVLRPCPSDPCLVCSLNPGAWPPDQAPIAWGILLSDVARREVLPEISAM
jgi:hypothetical protein